MTNRTAATYARISQAARPAASYVRISQDLEGMGLGVARQQEAIDQLVVREGLRVVGTYADNDRSAWNGKPREEFQELLEDIRQGRVQVVLAWAIDRLTRSLSATVELLEALKATGGILITCQEGTLDPNTADGEFRLGLMTLVARQESSRKSERVKLWAAQAAASGKSHGSLRAYGWDRQEGVLTINEAEAAVIRESAARVLSGWSLTGIARDLNDRGIPTSRGKQWGAPTLRGMLLSPRLAGLRAHNGTVVAKGQWDAILSEDTWARVCAILQDPARRTNHAAARRHLLTGLVVCDSCGQGMVHRPRADRTRRYVCISQPGRKGGKGCGKVSVAAQEVEDAVVAAALRVVRRTKGLPARLAGNVEEPTDTAGIEARLLELGADYDDGNVGREEYLARRTRLQAKLEEAAEAERLVSRRRTRAANLEDLDARWAGLTPEEQRAALDTLIHAVRILPRRPGAAPRFDPARVQVTWSV